QQHDLLQLLGVLEVGVDPVGIGHLDDHVRLTGRDRLHNARGKCRECGTGNAHDEQDAGEYPDTPRPQNLAELLVEEGQESAHVVPPPTSSTKTSSRLAAPLSSRS